MPASPEHRSSPRIPRNIPIRFCLAVNLEDDGVRDAGQDATLVDISATGMGILTSAQLHTGQRILFEREQPNWQLPTGGQVVWCMKVPDGFRAGIEFSM